MGRAKWSLTLARPLSWETLCQTKECGGGGIKALKTMNNAFLSKLIWRMRVEPDALWVQVLKGKYMLERKEGIIPVARATDSRLWKELVIIWEVFNDNAVFEVHDGMGVRVWLDNWLEGEGMLNKYIMEGHTINKKLCVQDLLDEEGKWELSPIEQALPGHILDKIRIIQLEKSNVTGQNQWKPASNGSFSTKSSYKLL